MRAIASEISVSLSRAHAAHAPIEVRPVKTRTSVTGKRMHWPPSAVSSTSFALGADLHVNDRLALPSFMR